MYFCKSTFNVIIFELKTFKGKLIIDLTDTMEGTLLAVELERISPNILQKGFDKRLS